MANIRHALIEGLTPLLPSTWTLYPGYAQPDVVEVPTVWMSLQKVERNPGNPMGHRLAFFILTVVTPEEHPDLWEDSVDDDLLDFLAAIDQLENVAWTQAERGKTPAGYGFEVTLTVPYAIEPPTN